MSRALITGITGQDGSYLAELLLEKGYEVHGMVRRSSTESFERIAHIADRVTLHQADLLDQSSLVSVLRQARPHELYNLAAQSFVPTSWLQPSLTGEFTALGVTRMLDAVRMVDPEIRFYQASSSEMYGRVREVPQNESTPFYPRSPYAVAKAGVMGLTRQLALELGPFGVRVNCVAPGVIASGRLKRVFEITGKKDHGPEGPLSSIPMKRLGTVEECAALIVTLCTDDTSYMTGVTVDVNGASYAA